MGEGADFDMPHDIEFRNFRNCDKQRFPQLMLDLYIKGICSEPSGSSGGNIYSRGISPVSRLHLSCPVDEPGDWFNVKIPTCGPVDIRRSYDRLISMRGFPVERHFPWRRAHAFRNHDISLDQNTQVYVVKVEGFQQPGPRLKIRTVCLDRRVPIIKMRRSPDCLIFVTGISILVHSIFIKDIKHHFPIF